MENKHPRNKNHVVSHTMMMIMNDKKRELIHVANA